VPLRTEATPATRQAMIDRGHEVIAGVHKYRLAHEDELDILAIDTAAVRYAPVPRLHTMRAPREQAASPAPLPAFNATPPTTPTPLPAHAAPPRQRAALAALTETARTEGNLLAAAVAAARARASVGEISQAMEDAFGRHRAEVKTLAGVYGAAYEGDAGFAAIQKDVEAFAAAEGRRPRMLVVKMGQDGHDRGAKVIATAFADIGFDVDVGPLFQTPAEAAQDAVDNDVHVVGISSQAAGHKTLAPQLVEALKAADAEDIIVICGGVIPQQDYQYLYDHGVKAIFGPGTNIPAAAQDILRLIGAAREAA